MKQVNVSYPVVYRDRFDFDVKLQQHFADELFKNVDKYEVQTSIEHGGKSTANLVGTPGHIFPHDHEINAILKRSMAV